MDLISEHRKGFYKLSVTKSEEAHAKLMQF